MEPADDRGSVSSRLRAFLPLLICFTLLFAALAWLLHTSRARKATIQFTVSIEGSPVYFYSARLNGSPYRSDERCGLGSKSVVIEAPDAEPFQTNVFAWYSGADLGNINLARSKGTVTIEVAPPENQLSIRGQHFQKEIANCTNETVSVPVGEYEVVSQFQRFQITRRTSVRRNSSVGVSIRPAVTTASLSAEPAEAEFRFECQSGFPVSVSGKTPAFIDGLPTGIYHLTMWRGKFQKTATVELTSDPTNLINVPFDYAIVSFKSDPSGAEIRQADEVLGKTPTILSLIPGSYRLSVTREGFFPKDSEFQVIGNEQRELVVTLLNVEFVEAFNRAKSALNGFNPDYSVALKEIDRALEIQAKDSNALQLRDQIQFAETMARARNFARANDVEAALKFVNVALEKRPADEHAVSLKHELEGRKSDAMARAADERRRRPEKAFQDFTSGIKHNDLFDTQKITVNLSAEKTLAAAHRMFLKDKIVWTRVNRGAGKDVHVVDAEMRSLASKQRAIILVGQISGDTSEVHFKLWQYKLSGNIQIINGKMTEDSWSPVHPTFSSWTPEVVNRQRASDIDALRQKLEQELRTQ